MVGGPVLCEGQRRVNGRRGSVCCEAEWRPEGLLGLVVKEKMLLAEPLEKLVLNRPDHPLAVRANFADGRNPPGLLYRALRRGDGRLAVMGELKRFHPEEEARRGRGRASVVDYDPRTLPMLAKGVEDWGCDATMLWTDSGRYGGDVEHLRYAKSQLTVPLVRGDFIVHPLQISEASINGADAILLVAGACLPDLEDFLNIASLTGLECIVEVHTQLEMEFAVEAGATILLCTNLDRRTNTVVPGTAEMLRQQLPDFIITVAGGEISSAGECWDLLDEGFDAVMLGRTLFNTRHGEELIKEIRSRKADQAMRFFRGIGFSPDDTAKPFDPTTPILDDDDDDQGEPDISEPEDHFNLPDDPLPQPTNTKTTPKITNKTSRTKKSAKDKRTTKDQTNTKSNKHDGGQ